MFCRVVTSERSKRVSAGPFRSKVLQRAHVMNYEKKQVKNLQAEKRFYSEFFSLRWDEKCKGSFRPFNTSEPRSGSDRVVPEAVNCKEGSPKTGVEGCADNPVATAPGSDVLSSEKKECESVDLAARRSTCK